MRASSSEKWSPGKSCYTQTARSAAFSTTIHGDTLTCAIHHHLSAEGLPLQALRRESPFMPTTIETLEMVRTFQTLSTLRAIKTGWPTRLTAGGSMREMSVSSYALIACASSI